MGSKCLWAWFRLRKSREFREGLWRGPENTATDLNKTKIQTVDLILTTVIYIYI